MDLGIFVKSVLHGGAASRDGRLKTNDQLVSTLLHIVYLVVTVDVRKLDLSIFCEHPKRGSF